MTAQPDPQLVRELASAVMADVIRTRSADAVRDAIPRFLPNHTRYSTELHCAVANAMDAATLVVTWPDERDVDTAADPPRTPAMRIRRTLHEVNGDLRTSDPDLFAAGVRFVVEIACRECKTETRWTAADVVACPACSAHAAGLYCGDRRCGPCSFDCVSGRFGGES